MKTEWDYTNLAKAYLKRPDYANDVINKLLDMAATSDGPNAMDICDVGAGVAHLTLALAKRGNVVIAIEPNNAMRAYGIKKTASFADVCWVEATAEQTGQRDGSFDLVTFGSSFNVTEQQKTLAETKRILRHNGWFACLWNHRDLSDPVQAEIESIIKSSLPTYGYGARREDQTAQINASGLFGPVEKFDAPVKHQQSIKDCVEAWRSHATLQRQAGTAFPQIIANIEGFIAGLGLDIIAIPYTTRVWMAQVVN
ncbi:MAG: class I SAM-dependent methyltransferase [Gammaproteobacteria bacterium]|nr:class I SAM-dependent methyltransferase [Gammaproteobacteria bacterium]